MRTKYNEEYMYSFKGYAILFLENIQGDRL